ncbi:MAG: hypothetical protein KGD64_05010 [Candidatus Heimdallarchaeota archaeon]|nr:hypothetical protein [Candidatus Heimdallarchaeota archaeon]
MIKCKKTTKWNFFLIIFILMFSVTFSQKLLAFRDQPAIGSIVVEISDNPMWMWDMTEVVSIEGASSSTNHDITTDNSGNVYITWEDGADYDGAGWDHDIFLRIWNATSLSWSTTEVVSTETTTHSQDPSIAVDSYHNVHLAWSDIANYTNAGYDSDIFYRLWNATSLSWSTTEVVSTESTSDSIESDLAVDSEGNVHVFWVDTTDYSSAGTDTDIFYKFKNATDEVWTTTEVISAGSTAASRYQSVGVDSEGNAHIVWRDETSNYASSGSDIDIFYKSWNVASSSWSAIEVVSTESTQASIQPSLAIDSYDNLHVCWQDSTDYGGADTGYDIFYKFWNATTLIWTITEVASTETPSSISADSPSIAVDTLGNSHVIWSQYNVSLPPGVDKDILYNFRNATDSSWNITEVASTESTANSWNNEMTTDIFGNVHLIWSDQTDYTGAGTDTDVFYKRLTLSHLPTPVLEPIVPNPSNIENITLHWRASHFADKYYVYRSNSSIASSVGLTPIAILNSITYEDCSLSNDIYYYVIVATTPYLNSSLSNEMWVEVDNSIIPEYSIEAQFFIGLILGTSLLVILRNRKKTH